MDEHGFSRIDLIHSLGYHNTLRGLRRLDPWLDRGEGYNRILNQIATVYPAHAEALTKAVAATAKAKAAEAETAFLERCEAERESFTPYIHADGETTIPNGITFFRDNWRAVELDRDSEDHSGHAPRRAVGELAGVDGGLPATLQRNLSFFRQADGF